MKKRDSQRRRVYVCDAKLYRWAEGWPRRLRTFADVLELRAFAAQIMAWAATEALEGRPFPESPYFIQIVERPRMRLIECQQWTSGRVEIRVGAAKASRTFNFSNVLMLHELAHAFAPLDALHGPVFCANYVRLVRISMGGAAASKLIELFREYHIDYRPDRVKRRISPEHRAVLIERLQKARDAKAARRAQDPLVLRETHAP